MCVIMSARLRMIRIFARRPLLFCAFAMCAGAGLVLAGYYSDNITMFVLALLALCLIVMFAFIAEHICTKKPLAKRFIEFTSKNKCLWLALLITYVAGGLLCDAKLKSFEDIVDLDTQYYVAGTVSSINEYSTSVSVILKDVKIADETTARGLNGKLKVLLRGDVLGQIEKGQKVGFYTETLSSIYQSGDKLSSYELVKEISYTATATINSSNAINYIGASKTLADATHEKVLNYLLEEMPQEIAFLSYSVLFGDSDYLSEMTNTSFKISGVAHIVAVSGMNVVFIISIILMCLRFLNKKYLLKFLVVAVALILYCYFCDFTSSVVRATIMGLVVMFSHSFGKQGDLLSSMGLSCIIILIIWPMSILDAGFLMSFACVFGIAFFCNPILDFLKKWLKCPNWLASGLAMTISSQIGIYPIMAQYFNSFSVYSLIANIVVVPVFSLAYTLLFASLLIVMVFPFMAFILKISAIPMSFVYWFPSLFVYLPFASVYVFEMNAFMVLYYVVMCVVSSFVFVKDKLRLAVNGVLITGLASALIITNIPKTYKSDSITTLCDNCFIVTTTRNEKILLGVSSRYNAESYAETIMRKKINTLDAIIMFDLSTDPYEDRETLEYLQNQFIVKYVIVDETAEYAYASLVDKTKYGVSNFEEVGNILKGATLNRLYFNNSLLMTILELTDFSVVIIPDGLTAMQLNYVRNVLPNNTYLHYTDDTYADYFQNINKLEAVQLN